MKNRLLCALLAALMLLFSIAPAMAAPASVNDLADLFTTAEISDIEEAISRFESDTNMAFVVLTSEADHDGKSQQQIADDFYDRGGYGLDSEHSGVIYFIDMNERWHYLSTTGAMIDYLTDERIDSAIENCRPALSRGDYAGAVLQMITLVEGYIQRGIPEGQYRYDVVTGQRLTERHRSLTMGEIVLCLVAGLVVALIFILIVRSRYKLRGSTYEYDYAEQSTMHITDSEDAYTHTTTTRTRKPDPPEGGGGGGSGVHTSSSGTSHGGGGGSF